MHIARGGNIAQKKERKKKERKKERKVACNNKETDKEIKKHQETNKYSTKNEKGEGNEKCHKILASMDQEISL